MGIDLMQWRVQIALYYKFAGRSRASRGRRKAGAASSSARRSPVLALTMAFCLITAPSLLLQAGDVERNPGPGQTLGVKDLDRVRDELKDVSHKWFELGLACQLRLDTLVRVRDQYPAPSTALREVLLHWLKWVDLPPTWEGLACALESPTVGEPWLAEQLRTKYRRTEGAAVAEASSDGSSQMETAIYTTQSSLQSPEVEISDVSVHSKDAQAIPTPEDVYLVRNELHINFREVAVFLYNRNLVTSEQFQCFCGTKLTREQKLHKLLIFLRENPNKMEDFLDSLEDSERKNLIEKIKDATGQTGVAGNEFERYISTRPPSPKDEPGELGDERLSELPYQNFLSEFRTLFTDGFAVKDNIADAVLKVKTGKVLRPHHRASPLILRHKQHPKKPTFTEQPQLSFRGFSVKNCKR